MDPKDSDCCGADEMVGISEAEGVDEGTDDASTTLGAVDGPSLAAILGDCDGARVFSKIARNNSGFEKFPCGMVTNWVCSPPLLHPSHKRSEVMSGSLASNFMG